VQLFIKQCSYSYSGLGSSVGVAIGYGLDCPGSNLGAIEIFRTCPDLPWGPPNLLYTWYGFFSGVKAAGA